MSNDSSNNNEKPLQHMPSSVPWGPGAAIIVTALVFLLSQIGVGVICYLLFGVVGWTSQRTDQWLSSTFGQFLTLLLSETLLMCGIWWFLHRRNVSFRLLGYARRPAWRDIGYAALAFLVYLIALLVLSTLANVLFHLNLDQKQDIGFDHVAGATQKVLTLISLVLLPPIAEETAFRGLLFGGLRAKVPFVAAAVITSVLFAAPHLLESSSGPLWVAGLDTFILSLVLCYLREKTGALWAGIAVHMAKNSLAFLFLYVFTGH